MKVSIEKTFYSDSKLLMEQIFKDGVYVSTKRFDKGGKVTFEQNYSKEESN